MKAFVFGSDGPITMPLCTLDNYLAGSMSAPRFSRMTGWDLFRFIPPGPSAEDAGLSAFSLLTMIFVVGTNPFS